MSCEVRNSIPIILPERNSPFERDRIPLSEGLLMASREDGGGRMFPTVVSTTVLWEFVSLQVLLEVELRSNNWNTNV